MKKLFSNLDLYFIIALSVVLLLLINNSIVNVILAIAFFCFILLQLLRSSARELFYFDTIHFVGVAQLIILPLFNTGEMQNIKRYFFIMIPGYFFFYLGTNFIVRRSVILKETLIYNFFSIAYNRRLAIILIYLGIAGAIIPSLVKNNAILNLLGNFSGIGMCMGYGLMYFNKKKYFIYPLVFFVIILIQGILSAVFASVIGYAILSFVFIPSIYKFTVKKIILLILSGVLFISFFQNVKSTYRSMVWSDNERTFDFALFVDAAFSPKNEEALSVTERANAGGTTAKIYEYVPQHFPHLYGENLIKDLSNALLPRFLFPSKEEINNSANYQRYTGNSVGEATSVGINVFGVSYAEFGIIGSWIFLFIFGFLLCQINNLLVSKGFNNIRWLPFLLIIPSIFSSFFKFEAEFVGQFVGFIRSILVSLFIFKMLDVLKIGFKSK